MYRNKLWVYLKYIISGGFFTIFGPIIFIYIANYLEYTVSMFISQTFVHLIRFNIYKYLVFKPKSSSLFSYIFSILPLFILNIIIANRLAFKFKPYEIGIIVAFISATLGYLWTSFCYRNISSKSYK